MDLVQKMGYVCAFDTRYTEEGCSKETADVISLQCAQRESDFFVCFVCVFLFLIVHTRENIQRHLPEFKAERGGGVDWTCLVKKGY